jgi:hypothetical protein
VADHEDRSPIRKSPALARAAGGGVGTAFSFFATATARFGTKGFPSSAIVERVHFSTRFCGLSRVFWMPWKAHKH